MGITKIAAAFATARSQDRAALMPYYTLGYPDAATTVAVLQAIAAAGADLIELGIPFSDPLADGPTIQRSSQIALAQGITVAGCLELTARLRQGGVSQPLLLMGYVNPMLSYGATRFVADAAAAGADGLIVPDLPIEEAGEIAAACAAHDLALIYLAAPTTADDRLTRLAEATTGFLYLVSVTGVTGVRAELPADLAAFVGRARGVARTPLAVGFGIATPAQAHAVSQMADGVIVGSALINAVTNAVEPAAAAQDLVRDLRAAVNRSPISRFGASRV